MVSDVGYGGTIKKWRELRHMTREDLAAALDVSVSSITAWETGKNPPKRGTARQLDALLAADGEVLEASGYPSASMVATVSREDDVSARLAALADEVHTNGSQVAEVLAAVRRIAALVERIAAQAVQPGESADPPAPAAPATPRPTRRPGTKGTAQPRR